MMSAVLVSMVEVLPLQLTYFLTIGPIGLKSLGFGQYSLPVSVLKK